MLLICLTELPKPQLGELKELRALRMQPAQEDVLTLFQTLDKLLARDSVQVELIPEKKGLFLKYVEYQVTSQASNPKACSTHKHSYRPTPLQHNQTWCINAKQRKKWNDVANYNLETLISFTPYSDSMAMTFIYKNIKRSCLVPAAPLPSTLRFLQQT